MKAVTPVHGCECNPTTKHTLVVLGVRMKVSLMIRESHEISSTNMKTMKILMSLEGNHYIRHGLFLTFLRQIMV